MRLFLSLSLSIKTCSLRIDTLGTCTGARIPIAPGRARNDLIPRGKALLVVGGKVVSSSRDMLRRESMLKRYVPAAAALPVAQDLVSPSTCQVYLSNAR